MHHEKPTLVEKVIGKFGTGREEEFFALEGVSLQIKRGERVGIIGNNGSGKTTLLRIVAGITQPTSGDITIEGKIVSLIDINAGFHPDLSGYENVYLNSLFLGMDRKTVDEKLNEIVEFADVGSFLDAPFYTYSNGMRLRLGFSVCIHAEADIFVFDESIYVGDDDFQKKIRERIRHLISKRSITILGTSHVIDFLADFCNRAIWLDRGKIKYDGSLQNAVKKYYGYSS